MDIKQGESIIIETILRKHLPPNATVWVFGSRATDKAKPFSDLDLAIEITHQNISSQLMADIAYDFEESDLPYKVDIIDWSTTKPSFKELIKKDRIVFLTT